MITMKRHIFDLDNTLIYTDSLNNASYAYAMNQHGLSPIDDCKRITRDVVFNKYPDLEDAKKNAIIALKQEYFMSNLTSTIPNVSLLQFLETQSVEHCMLWTSADEARVFAILEHYNIKNTFKKILFSDKVELLQDIQKIYQFFECGLEHLVFYEDNMDVIQDLKQLNLNVMLV